MAAEDEDRASRREELHVALDEHIETGRWGDAADMLVALSDLETEREARARYLHAAGLVCRDRLKDHERAEALFGVALVDVGGEGAEALRGQLWSGLGVTARSLGDRETALAAFAAAEALAPDDAGPVRFTAELQAEGGDRTLAAAAYQRLVAHAPDAPAPYQALVRLWADDGHRDRVWWATSALEQLGEPVPVPNLSHAGASEATGSFGATGTLDDEAWQRLAHPDEDQAVSAVFALVAPSLVLSTARSWDAFQEEHGAPLDLSPDVALVPPLVLAYVTRVLDVASPALFLGEAKEPVTVHLLEREGRVAPALLVDRAFADDASTEALAFALGRATALLRPPWVLRHALPVSGLERVLRAARAVSEGAHAEDPEDERLARVIGENPSPAALQSLKELTGGLGPQVDVRRWIAASELSAARAALALTGDLAAAKRIVASEAPGGGVLPAAERIKDLLAFCVSEDHFAVRRTLGVGALTSAERGNAQ